MCVAGLPWDSAIYTYFQIYFHHGSSLVLRPPTQLLPCPLAGRGDWCGGGQRGDNQGHQPEEEGGWGEDVAGEAHPWESQMWKSWLGEIVWKRIGRHGEGVERVTRQALWRELSLSQARRVGERTWMQLCRGKNKKRTDWPRKWKIKDRKEKQNLSNWWWWGRSVNRGNLWEGCLQRMWGGGGGGGVIKMCDWVHNTS